jgi:hypothetical protein
MVQSVELLKMCFACWQARAVLAEANVYKMRLRLADLLFMACCVKADRELRGTRRQHKLADLECKAGITDGPDCKKPEPFHQLTRELKVTICPENKGQETYEAVRHSLQQPFVLLVLKRPSPS